MSKLKKKRLDELLMERGLVKSLKQAAALVGAGQVVLDGEIGGKVGNLYRDDISLELVATKEFVSRSGGKLVAGLNEFSIDPSGFICADIGCSTGGFTDCLLKKGAKKVYAVDVGYGLLDWKLRNDNRVVLLEKLNARYINDEHIPEPIDLCVVDVSFISLKSLFKPLINLFAQKSSVSLLVLIKPQFELSRNLVPRGGVVRDCSLHDRAINDVVDYAASLGLNCRGVVKSPVKGNKGNQEFLACFYCGN